MTMRATYYYNQCTDDLGNLDIFLLLVQRVPVPLVPFVLVALFVLALVVVDALSLDGASLPPNAYVFHADYLYNIVHRYAFAHQSYSYAGGSPQALFHDDIVHISSFPQILSLF